MNAAPALAPLSAGELLDHAIVMGRRHFLIFLRPIALLYLAGCAVGLIGRSGISPVGPYISFVVTLGVFAVAECLAIICAYDVLHGVPPAALRPWARLRPRFWPAVLGCLVKAIFVILGLVALVLPGVYLLCLYFAVPTVSLTEDLGVRAARSRSRMLARPHLKRIFLSVGLVEVSVGLSTVILGYSLRYLGLTPNPYAMELLGWLIGLVFLPFKASLLVLVYLDCRVRSEGYDLDRQAAALSAA